MVSKLLIADSETCPDLLWATGFHVPDPVIYFEKGKKNYLAVSDLEYSRARKESNVDVVIPLSRYSGGKGGFIGLLAVVLRKEKIGSVAVPSYTPAQIVDGLRKQRFKVQVLPDPFFPGRVFKTAVEKKNIVASLKATEGGIAQARKVLEKSRIRNGFIVYKGKKLTSEFLKQVINGYLFERGYLGRQTIVAGGAQGADPHCRGTGLLKAHQPIVIDVFPRSETTGYHGDISRTFVKGKATDKVRKMHQAVR
ncbi:MAG: M24 family metallopeptidase, partial [bacterium]|nr:M24 family metallopeptidase [bacterium]